MAAKPSPEPPAEFIELVRDALAHLYEPAQLASHPLGVRLRQALPPLAEPGQSLRLHLLEALEALRPCGPHASEKAARPYNVLVQRYVGGLSPREIASRLNIGLRQLRREHQLGLERLAARLWQEASATAQEEPPGPESDSLLREVHALGVSLQASSLQAILEASWAPAQALAAQQGAAILTSAAEGVRCLCDRILAKQAFLSALAILLAGAPERVRISGGEDEHGPWLALAPCPPLGPEVAAAAAQRLPEVEALMATQGGQAQALWGQDGKLKGVELRFRAASRAHVLVVDDNEKMLRLYERYLAMGNCRVSTAASAAAAEELVARARPDLIILDVMMRERDGWELLQSLRARPGLEAVPIVVCTVLNEPELARALGAQAFLRKPVTAESLLAVLAQLVPGSNPAAPHRKAP